MLVGKWSEKSNMKFDCIYQEKAAISSDSIPTTFLSEYSRKILLLTMFRLIIDKPPTNFSTTKLLTKFRELKMIIQK